MTTVSVSGPFSKLDLRNEGWLNHWQFCISSLVRVTSSARLW